MAMATRKGRTPPPVEQVPPGAKQIDVDFGELLFGDLLLFQAAAADDMKLTPDVIEALDRVVVGGIKHRKVKETQAILEAIAAKSKELGDSGN